ncbi:hypothetical protein C7M61_001524 [Candidozyma pseudohaemuli]|uniref:GTP-binding protein n=1 Tax=Candidozyma pseudohaemuli TaxID=418784 RepID=A0A2P7YUT9_9ASCO|nr:hypothetical protein C7M61_001524 [[Candida] pseudohaemulonii]PSK39719.1 hypothetical protein C7M61_001524 [[Candida] pseudohaemulonii]
MNRILDGLSSLNTQYDILVMGETGVGKTSLVQRYVNGTFSEAPHDQAEQLYVKAVENELAETIVSSSSHNSLITEISILDSSPLADVYGASRKQQVKNTSTILFVYAMDDRQSFEALEYLIGTVKTFCDGELPPFVVVAAKLDMYETCQVWYDDGEAMANRFGASGFFLVSSLADINVNDCFVPLVEAALDARENKTLMAGRSEAFSLTEAVTASPDSSLHDFKNEKSFHFRRPSKIPASNSQNFDRHLLTSTGPGIESFSSEFPQIPESGSEATPVESPLAQNRLARKENLQSTSSISTGSYPSKPRAYQKDEKPKKEKSGCCIIV